MFSNPFGARYTHGLGHVGIIHYKVTLSLFHDFGGSDLELRYIASVNVFSYYAYCVNISISYSYFYCGKT